MRLNIDKRFVKAGTVIEVSWNAEEGNLPRLVLQSGQRETSLAVPLSGTKRFKMKGNKGKHCVKLVTNIYGKEKTISKRIFVYGNAEETDEFEYIDHGDASTMNQWKASCSRWWNSYTPEKKRLYILLLLLLTSNIIRSIPSLSFLSDILFYAIIFWLFWQVVKR